MILYTLHLQSQSSIFPHLTAHPFAQKFYSPRGPDPLDFIQEFDFLCLGCISYLFVCGKFLFTFQDLFWIYWSTPSSPQIELISYFTSPQPLCALFALPRSCSIRALKTWFCNYLLTCLSPSLGSEDRTASDSSLSSQRFVQFLLDSRFSIHVYRHI